MSDIEIGPEALASLAEKIESLELTGKEHAVLSSILDRAEAYEPEVEGFAIGGTYSGAVSGSGLATGAFTLGVSSGFVKVGGDRQFGSYTDPTDKKGWPPAP